MLLHWAVETLLPDRSGLRVLDLCAAPGGKSTLLASLLPDDALLVSNEVIRSRAGILEENIARWGRSNTWVTSDDPARFQGVPAFFDLLVVDAPCSGSGLFRKDPAALDHWSPEAVRHCAARQQRILADALPALKPGGLLLYATCSYSPEEDEAILEWLVGHQGLEPVPLQPDPAWGVLETAAAGATGLRCFPDRVRGEGFFLAALRKGGTPEAPRPARFRSEHDAKAAAGAAPLLRAGDWRCLRTGKEGFTAVQSNHESDWMQLREALYFRRVGIPVGAPAGKDWIPAHDLALSVDLASGVPGTDLELDAALRYLKGDDPGAADGRRGWLLARYDGVVLGWLKALGHRFNNHLPKNLRIRRNLDG